MAPDPGCSGSDAGPTLYAGPWRPDGRQGPFDTSLKVSIPGADAALLAAARTSGVASIRTLPSSARDLVWSPDGKTSLFLSDPDAIWIADIDRNGAMTDLRRLPTATQQQMHLMWSPDGKRLSLRERRWSRRRPHQHRRHRR